MGPIAIRAHVVRLARRARGRALAVVVLLGAIVAVHHATMAMHELPVPAAASAYAPAGQPAPAGDAAPHAVGHGTAAPADGAAPDHGGGHPVAAMAMAACLAVLGAVGAAVVAFRAGVVPLGRWPALRSRAPGLRAGGLPARRPRAGPLFVVLAVDRR